jgi:amino acid transporter
MLNRTLTLTDLTLFGVASIMGSGGFNLIGYGVRSGGALWPLALGISAALVLGSAYSYSSAYARFKKNTSESDMIRSVLGPYGEWLGSAAILVYGLVHTIVILVLCSKMILPNAAWSSQVSLTVAILGIMSVLATLGIDLDKHVINTTTWLLIAVLVAVLALGLYGSAVLPVLSQTTPSRGGFMNSLWMFFFVLVGFDAIMKFAEEMKVEGDIPSAFYLSNGISILLTAGVAVAVSTWLPHLTGSQEHNAVGLLFSQFLGKSVVAPFQWMVIVCLLLTSFVIFLATSRYLYGLGSPFHKVNDAKVPWVSIATLFGSGSIVALLNNTELLVKITDIGFAVIASLVAGSAAIADFRDGSLGSATINGATGLGFVGLLASAFL